MTEVLCATRDVKVLKYIRRTAPETISPSSLEALEDLPSGVLTGLLNGADLEKVTSDPQLKSWLAKTTIPTASAALAGPLFEGTLVFAQIIAQSPGQSVDFVGGADIQTAIQYATIAAQPIQRYASQYGPNSVGVLPTPMIFPTTVTGGSFTMSEFEGWVDAVANSARAAKVSNPCIVILHNRDLPGSPQFSGQRDSFHSQTGNGTPYCYSLVFGENLSVADNNHTINGVPNDKVYAHNLSHEIAEMVVDPKGDDSNLEVCDGCAGNCNISLFDLFDQNCVFLGGTANTAQASGFAFFINPIVSRGAQLDSNFCVTPASNAQNACVYPPPFIAGELLSYGDSGGPGNVSNPMVVGFDDWLQFKFLFGGRNAGGQDRIYAVNPQGQLLAYADGGTLGNVSSPTIVGLGGWAPFKFLFSGRNAAGQDRIYAVNAEGQLLSYGDSGGYGNVSSPVTVGLGGWAPFRFLFGGRNALSQDRIYAVNAEGQLLSYGDSGAPGNVSSPVTVGLGGWSPFKFLFGGKNAVGQDRIYAVNAEGQLLSYADSGAPGNVSSPETVGFGGWLQFKFLFCGQNAEGQDRLYAVPN